MIGLPTNKRYLLSACSLAVLGCGPWVSLMAWDVSEPFRRERLEGREFDLNETSFLHRLSFQSQPVHDGYRRLEDNGFEGLGGSTRSNELYLRSHFRVRQELDYGFLALASFRRDEDLDGRYDAFLAGVGYQWEEWELRLVGDVHGAKEDTDIQLGMSWRDQHSPSAFHLQLIAVDLPFDDKQNAGEYLRAPYTIAFSGRLAGFGPVELSARAGWNAPTRLLIYDDFIADDEQVSGSLALTWRVADAWLLGLQTEALYGERAIRRASADVPSLAPLNLRRVMSRNDLTLIHQHSLSCTSWASLRYFSLRENDHRPASDPGSSSLERHEYTVSFGYRRQILSRWWAAPAVHLAYHDIRHHYPDLVADEAPVDSTGKPLPMPSREAGFYGKFSPVIEYLVDRQRQGMIALNMSLYLHRAAFGGGNLQFSIPF